MNNLLARRPRVPVVHVGYETAGVALADAAVPWNADAVTVEADLRLPPSARRKTDFALRLPGRPPLAADTLRPDGDDRHRVAFRFPVPAATAVGELLFRNRVLAVVRIPVLPAADFLAGLTLTLPTIAVRLGNEVVAAQTFVASQCRGLVASAVLSSPTRLAPLADLGVRVTFRNERTGGEYVMPVPLSSSQLGAKQVVLTAVPPKVPRRVGAWTVTWAAGERVLARKQVQGIFSKRFEASLRVADTRFVTIDKKGRTTVARQVPVLDEVDRLGPCFLIASAEPGVAGLCRLAVHAAVAGDDRPTVLAERDVLVTDGPATFAPDLIPAADLTRLSGFELRHKGKTLGVLSLSPVPRATLTAEGGFKPASDFAWSPVADEELSERLQRLMGGGE